MSYSRGLIDLCHAWGRAVVDHGGGHEIPRKPVEVTHDMAKAVEQITTKASLGQIGLANGQPYLLLATSLAINPKCHAVSSHTALRYVVRHAKCTVSINPFSPFLASSHASMSFPRERADKEREGVLSGRYGLVRGCKRGTSAGF